MLKDSEFGFLRARFDTGFNSKHFNFNHFCYSGPLLAHYTNLDGLIGIIESGGFWLSDHRYLNDVEEFNNGRKLTCHIIDAVKCRKRHKEFKTVLEGVINYLNSLKENPYFIASFSIDPDSLEQWRGYARDEKGLSIVFNNNGSFGKLSHFMVLPIMTPSKVIYNDFSKIRIIVRTIAKYSIEFKKDISIGNHINLDTWVEQMSKSISLEFINFKNPAFASENEVRIAVAESHLNHFNSLEHRCTKDRIIPYINSADLYNESFYEHCDSKQLPVKEIIVGPTSNQEVTIKSIKTFLNNRGYCDIPVKKSTVPFRG